MIRQLSMACLACAASVALAAEPVSPADTAVLAQLPVRFEANQGQFAPAVAFAARGLGYQFALTGSGATLTFGKSPVNLHFAGANPAARLEGLDRLSTTTDYCIGARANWHSGVPSFSRVQSRSIYPGIDLVYYGAAQKLEYDFIVQPHANPKAIRLQFSGADNLRITPAGDLAVLTAEGLVLQKKPVTYQEDAHGIRREISSQYALVGNNTAAIRLGSYDHSRALIIDPAISYSTLIGGSQTDQVVVLKTRPNKLYIAGWTQTGEIPTTDTPYANLTDSFIQIVDTTPGNNYKILYSTYLGGTSLDIVSDMDIDSGGFIYVTGTTTSTDFPIVGNAVQTTGATTTVDGFVTKIDPNHAGSGNSIVYSTYLGGTVGDDLPKGIRVGTDNMIYVVGTTKSPDFPVTDNAYAQSLYGPSDIFVTKIDTTNTNLVYSTVMGSETDDAAIGMVLGPNNLVIYAANTYGTTFPMAGSSYNGNTAGSYDIVVDAIDTTKSGVASLIYGTYFGGSDTDIVKAISLDSQGRVLLAGYTLSSDFPVTASTAIQSQYQGNADAFVSVLDITKPGFNALVYSTYLGGTQGEVAYAVAGDSAGYLYVTGYTLSPDFPVANGFQNSWGNGVDLFLTRFKPGVKGLAAIDYSTYMGTDSVTVGTALAVDSNLNLYTGGYTLDYLPLVGPSTQGSYGGGFSDGFFFVIPGPAKSPTPPASEHSEVPIGRRPKLDNLLNKR